MDYTSICIYTVLVYVVIQCIVGCGIRIYSNGVLIDPVIRSKKKLNGYYAIVTGSNQGIGYEVARYLVNHGAYVILACRNNERGKKAEAAINHQIKANATYAGGKAEFIQCDLSKLSSVKSFIQDYKDKKYPLHLLINNAGFSCTKKAKFTQDGIAIGFQVNYLSHFLLTYELIPLLMQSSKDKKYDCRIINTSSINHKYAYLDFDTLKADKHTQAKRYKGGYTAYNNSKLAQILHATYLQTEVFTKLTLNLSICSLHPGGVATNIFRVDKWPLFRRILLVICRPAILFAMRDAEAGSRNTVYCAIAPIGDHSKTWGGSYVPGAYHVNLKQHITGDKSGQSTDPKAMKKLYQHSLDVLKLETRSKEDYMKYLK